MSLPEMQEFLTNQGVVRGVRVTEQNADQIAKEFGGTTLVDMDAERPEISGVRVPTLYGNLDVQIDEYLLRESSTGRLSSMSEQQFKQTYFVEADQDLITKANELYQQKKSIYERQEAMRNHPSSYPNPTRVHDLYEQRQKNANGDTD